MFGEPKSKVGPLGLDLCHLAKAIAVEPMNNKSWALVGPSQRPPQTLLVSCMIDGNL